MGQPGQLDKAKLAREAQERSNMYGFLAAVYRAEPTAELLRQIRAPVFFSAITNAGVKLGEDFWNPSEDHLLSELSLEYTRLFVGPGNHVSPYESVHAGASGSSLWGEAASAIQRAVASTGLEFHTDYRGMPDHICVELEFMQQLTGAESRAWLRQGNAAGYLYTESEFLNKHLTAWVPTFCDKVVKTAECTFYKEMAALTVGFVQSDQEGIERLIRQLPSTERD